MVTEADDVADFLTMTCVIERDTQSVRDESGKLMPPDFTELATDVDCFFESEMDFATQEMLTAKTVVERINMMFKAAVDITTKDRVTTIVRKGDASVVDDGPLYILEVRDGEDFETGAIHHVECVMKREEGS